MMLQCYLCICTYAFLHHARQNGLHARSGIAKPSYKYINDFCNRDYLSNHLLKQHLKQVTTFPASVNNPVCSLCLLPDKSTSSFWCVSMSTRLNLCHPSPWQFGNRKSEAHVVCLWHLPLRFLPLFSQLTLSKNTTWQHCNKQFILWWNTLTSWRRQAGARLYLTNCKRQLQEWPHSHILQEPAWIHEK